MPNGGIHHCGGCQHLNLKNNVCLLRKITIIATPWTTCRDKNKDVSNPTGPVYSIVCEVKNKGGSYCDLPWFDGNRVDTEQAPNGGDTIVVVKDGDGHRHEFPDADAYMDFWDTNTPEEKK